MEQKSQINDFVVRIATVNGTGSASANALLLKSIFRMGVPVVGKNYFPSNIQGLPTWYEIRVTHEGYLARSGHINVMVAMNAQTYAEDLACLDSGGALLYDGTWLQKDLEQRTDIEILPIPLSEMCNKTFTGARVRILMKNIAYVGALGALLNLDMTVLQTVLIETFGGKKNLIESNTKAIELGYSYVVEHFDYPLETRLQTIKTSDDRIMVDGNTAAALGCVYAGATVASWYPITPSTSLVDAFGGFCGELRQDAETGQKNYCIIQTEDELAAIGCALGAAWSGARSFTATSGPGLSLMSEFLGLAYFTEIPLVLFDIQRVGPSTGMPTRTQQGDITAAAYASHGDTRHVLLFPCDPSECFYMTVEAFDLADRLQTPVIVLSDLDIGMNDWSCLEFTWDDSYRPDYGKVYDFPSLEKMEVFHRYLDVDGDGICYRTLPGVHPTGSYLVRGSGHNQYGGYTEREDEYREVVDRLRRKFDTAASLVPEPIFENFDHADSAIISLGSCDGAVREAQDILAREGIQLDYMRLRSFPFGRSVRDFLDNYERLFVVEQNRDGQLRSLLLTETEVRSDKLISVLSYGGQPMSYQDITPRIIECMGKAV
jgi:2-oxoglutarate ferredoxin oxidoreductase subunit alpha